MITAKRFWCRIEGRRWLTPSVMEFTIQPSHDFEFAPGQFLSIYVPDAKNPAKPIRRIYSFSTPPDDAKKNGFQLCVKFTGGLGTSFLKSLGPGQSFEASAPYGEFVYRSKPKTRTCFISTGTGIAPLKSMLESTAFQQMKAPDSLWIFGCRTEDEILYPGIAEKLGHQAVYAVSQPTGKAVLPPDVAARMFKGRVTDYLKSLPADSGWHTTDFYLCGNGTMIGDVVEILKGGHGVNDAQIHQEQYFEPGQATNYANVAWGKTHD